ncbi:MAG: ABC transporter ATP-binding protein [Aggregatilineales bacterium]
MDTAVFDVQHISKRYGDGLTANDDLLLTIGRGKIWGLFGPNGAGKTTLVRQMLGLLKPTGGQVLFHGRDVLTQPQNISTQIGYLPQSSSAFYDFTAQESLYFTGRLRGMTHSAAQAQTEQFIATWEFEHIRKKVFRRLSGGQQRLVQLAAILMGDPQALVLDEPTNHMDPAYRRMVWGHLQRLNAQGVTILLVTHHILEVQNIVTDMAIMDGGRILVQGTPDHLRAQLDDRVHLDLSVTDGAIQHLQDDIRPMLEQVDALRWRMTIPQQQANGIIGRITNSIPSGDLIDLHLHHISLEDYYLSIVK